MRCQVVSNRLVEILQDLHGQLGFYTRLVDELVDRIDKRFADAVMTTLATNTISKASQDAAQVAGLTCYLCRARSIDSGWRPPS